MQESSNPWTKLLIGDHYCLFHGIPASSEDQPYFAFLTSFLLPFIKEKSSPVSMLYHVTDALHRANESLHMRERCKILNVS